MPTVPATSGGRAARAPAVAAAATSSTTAMLNAAATTTTKPTGTQLTVQITSAASSTPIAVASGRLRPALDGAGAGVSGRGGWVRSGTAVSSYLEQFGFLVLEELVYCGHVLVGDVLELLLRTADLVLAGVAVVGQLLQSTHGVPADVADRDPRVLSLVLGDLDELAPALLGPLRERDPDHGAVVGRVHPEVAVPDRLLDRPQGTLVVGGDDDHPGVQDMERRHLRHRGQRAVVVGADLVEHRRLRPTRPDPGEVVAGDGDGLLHLLLGLEEGVVDHAVSLLLVALERAGSDTVGHHERADPLTPNCPADVAFDQQVEDHDRQAVVPAEADGGRVGDLQTTGEHLGVGQALEASSAWSGPRVGVVDPVDALGHQHDLGADLEGPLGGGGVGGEVGGAKAGPEDDHPALLQVADRPPGDVGLGDLAH